MSRCNHAAADEGEAEASECGYEHERVACGIGGAGPCGFRNAKRFETPQKTDAAQKNDDDPSALGWNVHNYKKHGEAAGVRQQRPRCVRRLDERLEKMVEDSLGVINIEKAEFKRPPQGG